MALLWPGFLVLLALLPLLVAAYIWALRRRRAAVRYSSLALVRAALPRQSRWRRHAPFALLALALAGLVLALARPVAIVSVPTNQTTIILAIDVSRSMCASDIQPTRLEVAEAAAVEFIQSQPPGTQIGLVAFARFAEMIQAPTTDRAALEAAVLSLTTGRRTGIGAGILRAIDAIAEVDPNVAPSVSDAGEPGPVPVAPGAYAPSIIVLLTDGASNSGPLPLDAAQQAADRGVRVYTIGFGTVEGGAPICPARLTGGELFGGEQFDFNFGSGFGGGGGFGGFRRGIDEETLKAVSALTGGEYYSAESAAELLRVFHGLPTNLITKHETTEITVAFTAFGALMAALALFLGLRWTPLP
jgi:Ca-activated chloride channel family protein